MAKFLKTVRIDEEILELVDEYCALMKKNFDIHYTFSDIVKKSIPHYIANDASCKADLMSEKQLIVTNSDILSKRVFTEEEIEEMLGIGCQANDLGGTIYFEEQDEKNNGKTKKLKKAMCAELIKVNKEGTKWFWRGAKELFEHRDYETGRKLDWRECVVQCAEQLELKTFGYDWSSIDGLAVFCCWEPIFLGPNLEVLENFKGVVNMPKGAVVMGDENFEPLYIIWEEDM